MALAMLFVFGWLWFTTYYNMYLVDSLIAALAFYAVWRLAKFWAGVKVVQGGVTDISLWTKTENFTRKNFINLFFGGILITQWIYDKDKFFALPAGTVYWYVALAYFGSWGFCAVSHRIFKG